MSIQRHFNTLGFLAIISVSAFVLLGSGEDSGSSSTADSSSSSEADSGESSEVDDVTISSCGADDLGQLEAILRITNNSSKPSNYLIDVAFESPDGSEQFDVGMAIVNTLQPGQSTTETAFSFTDAPADFTCRVTSVERFAS